MNNHSELTKRQKARRERWDRRNAQRDAQRDAEMYATIVPLLIQRL